MFTVGHWFVSPGWAMPTVIFARVGASPPDAGAAVVKVHLHVGGNRNPGIGCCLTCSWTFAGMCNISKLVGSIVMQIYHKLQTLGDQIT
jgi:hypothetical protein